MCKYRTVCATFFILWLLCHTPIAAQKFKSVSSNIHFYSDAPVEDIEATNLDGQSALDISSKDIVFTIPINGFKFEKSLMQEHFNENYMESDKFPKATYKGRISGFDTTAKGWQEAKSQGIINIHGIDKKILVEGQIKIEEDNLEIKAVFPVVLEDYKIKIPKVVFYNIAEAVDVTIAFKYEKIQ